MSYGAQPILAHIIKLFSETRWNCLGQVSSMRVFLVKKSLFEERTLRVIPRWWLLQYPEVALGEA